VIGLQALDLFDSLGEPHGEVEEDVTLVRGRGGTGQVPDVAGGGTRPVDDYEDGEEETAETV